MNYPEHKMLVIDDQVGRPGSFRESFLDKTGRSAEEFVFCTGQNADGRNHVDVVLDTVRALWEGCSPRRLSLVLLDVRFDDRLEPDGGSRFGFTVLRALRLRFGRSLPIVMLTSVDEARAEANAAQADSFLPKSELDPSKLRGELFRNGLYPEGKAGVMGAAPAFLLTLREVRRAVASGVAELLLLGETGTGKSELAGYAHRMSQRSGRFEQWFSRSANVDLHYDQLFGHWRGAFTGASGHFAGLGERAHEGTLFVDEIAELSPAGQTELLEYRSRRADGRRRVRRLGHYPGRSARAEDLQLFGEYSPEEDRILVDSILVSATNQPIDDDAWRRSTGFRQDLFNRLGHRVRLPPLRNRREDIVPLFEVFCRVAGDRQVVVVPEARRLLEDHDWREGNIAELKRVAETVFMRLGPGFDEVHPHHLDDQLAPGPVPQPVAGQGPPERFVDFEVWAYAGFAERLRTAVETSRRPTGLGSMADIWMQATGTKGSVTDIKRELKGLLEVWFAPNARQRVRWAEHPEYTRIAARLQADDILARLYAYASEASDWKDVKAAIEGLLGKAP